MSFPLFAALLSMRRHKPLDRTKSAIAPVAGGTAVALGIEPAYAKDIVLGSLAGPEFRVPKRGMLDTYRANNCAIGGWTVWAA